MKMQSRRAKKQNKRPRRSPWKRLGMVCSLILLVAVALFLPQMIFQVQDGLLCAKTILDEKESVDVEALGTTYEKSLYKRLLNFAEGMAAEEIFYVATQNLDVTQEVYSFLKSADLYQGILVALMEFNMIPVRYWEDGATVNQWKQYVIYSDDYAKGVNFILWYIEVKDITEAVVKLLVDAETGTIYAVKTEDNQHFYYDSDGGYLYSEIWMEDVAPNFWYYFAIAYEASANIESTDSWIGQSTGRTDQESNVSYYESMYDKALVAGSSDESLYKYDEIMQKDALEREEAMLAYAQEEMLRKNAGYWKEGRTMCFRLPYQEVSLEVRMEIGEVGQQSKYINIYPQLLTGIREIYELIPEFA